MIVQRPLSHLRLTLAVILATVFSATLGFLPLQSATAATPGSGITPPDRMPEDERVRTLSPTPVAQSASTASTIPNRLAAMPVMRDIRGLQSLRQSLQSANLETRQEAAHRAAILSNDTDNVSYLTNLRPTLQAIAYNPEMEDGTRLLALSTLYRITPDRSFRLVLQEKVETEPSEKVRHVMNRIITGSFEPKPVSFPA